MAALAVRRLATWAAGRRRSAFASRPRTRSPSSPLAPIAPPTRCRRYARRYSVMRAWARSNCSQRSSGPSPSSSSSLSFVQASCRRSVRDGGRAVPSSPESTSCAPSPSAPWAFPSRWSRYILRHPKIAAPSSAATIAAGRGVSLSAFRGRSMAARGSAFGGSELKGRVASAAFGSDSSDGSSMDLDLRRRFRRNSASAAPNSNAVEV
mmetsp:Transcript_46002/g.103909  ORF Transcript_46002/g.103909 Transcript_46002/m.103909 type:complete len:208 (-) Transcript_46002:120-743(-)